MRGFLFLLCIVVFLAGAGILMQAKGAIHEIEAFILFLISAVFFVGAGIVEAINSLKKSIDEGKE
jgi:hypothetical protein